MVENHLVKKSLEDIFNNSSFNFYIYKNFKSQEYSKSLELEKLPKYLLSAENYKSKSKDDSPIFILNNLKNKHRKTDNFENSVCCFLDIDFKTDEQISIFKNQYKKYDHNKSFELNKEQFKIDMSKHAWIVADSFSGKGVRLIFIVLNKFEGEFIEIIRNNDIFTASDIHKSNIEYVNNLMIDETGVVYNDTSVNKISQSTLPCMKQGSYINNAFHIKNFKFKSKNLDSKFYPQKSKDDILKENENLDKSYDLNKLDDINNLDLHYDDLLPYISALQICKDENIRQKFYNLIKRNYKGKSFRHLKNYVDFYKYVDNQIFSKYNLSIKFLLEKLGIFDKQKSTILKSDSDIFGYKKNKISLMDINPVQQEKRFFHLIKEKNDFDSYDSFIFDNNIIKTIFQLIKNHRDEYGKTPNFDTIKSLVNKYNEKVGDNSKINKEQLNQLFNDNEYQSIDKNWLIDEFNKHLKYGYSKNKIQKLTDDLYNGVDISQQLNIKILNQDISKINLENASPEDTKRYRTALNNSPVATVLSHTGNILDYNKEIRENKYLFYPLIRERQLGILFGITGEGKSILAVEMANKIAAGKTDWEIFRIDTEPQKVLYIDFEIGPEGFINRYPNRSKFHKNLIIYNVSVYEYNMMIGIDNKSRTKVDRAITFIEELSKLYESKIIFVDNLSNIADQVEQATDADLFISDLYGRMRALGLTIIFIGHTPKISSDSPITINQLKGSSSLTKTFENIWGFRRSKFKNISYLKQVKARSTEELFKDDVAKFEFNIDKNDGFNLKFIGVDNEDELLSGKNKNGRPFKYDNSIKCDCLYDHFEENMTDKDIMIKYNIKNRSTLQMFYNDYNEDVNNLIFDYEMYKKNKQTKDDIDEWMEK